MNKLTLSIFLVIVVASGGWAAEIPKELSLTEAISIALESNAQLKSAEENRLESLSRERIAGIKSQISFGTSASIERNDQIGQRSSRVFGSAGIENISGSTITLDLAPLGFGRQRGGIALEIRKPLTRGKGKYSTKADQLFSARSSVKISDKEFFVREQSTIRGVVNAYYNAVLAREQVKVKEAVLSRSTEAAEGAKKRAEAGLIAAIQASRADIRVAETNDDLVRAKQSEKSALDRLMVAIGFGVGSSTFLNNSIPDADTDIPELSTAIETALNNRAEMYIQEEQITEQTRILAIKTDRLKPGLDLVAGFDSTNRETGFLSDGLFSSGRYIAGVEYSVPLDKRALQEEREISARNLDVMKRMAEYQKEQIAEEVRRAHREVETAKRSLQILTDNLKTAQENLRLAVRMVEEGVDDNRNVLEAQDSLAGSENGVLAAKTDLYLATINLKYALGEDLTEIDFSDIPVLPYVPASDEKN